MCVGESASKLTDLSIFYPGRSKKIRNTETGYSIRISAKLDTC